MMNKSRLTLFCYGMLFVCVAQAAHCLPETFAGKADGKTLNTGAIQQAIQQCAERGGGTVYLSSGVWLSGPLQLQNNITLQISKDATLKASNQEGKFIPAFIGRPAQRNEAFIFASNVRNVVINGGGTLDGDGEKSWWPEALQIRAEVRSGNPQLFRDRFPGVPLANGVPRPWFIEFNAVSGGRIEQVHLTNSPMWNIVIRNSEHIDIHQVKISNPVTSPNTDGVDVVSSRDITMSNMDIHTGDDNIAIKSGLIPGTAAPAQDITIRDSVMRDGHGISAGSETANGIGRVTISNVTFLNTENGIRIKSARDRGNYIGPLTADNLTMTDVATPVLVTSSYSGQSGAAGHTLTSAIEHAAVTASTPKIRGIHISNLSATGASHAMIFSGLPESQVQDVVLKNIDIAAKQGVQARYVSGSGQHVRIRVEQGPIVAQGPQAALALGQDVTASDATGGNAKQH
ncbi:glycoside hydrolase family 28 protein [Erwinia mallotivora]|uniref:glycoside hydrolase family 28 protein n=1 Tax=Erwinia mallotivora TaxID=69222 RepID=UPI0035E91985